MSKNYISNTFLVITAALIGIFFDLSTGTDLNHNFNIFPYYLKKTLISFFEAETVILPTKIVLSFLN
jgi:hypothetical protein